MDNRDQYEQLRRTASDLGELYDSVLILVSNRHHESGGWVLSSAGSGNAFAQKGMAQQFLDQADNNELAYRISDILQGG